MIPSRLEEPLLQRSVGYQPGVKPRSGLIPNHCFLKERRIGVDRARVRQSGIDGVSSERKDLVGMVLRAVPFAGMRCPLGLAKTEVVVWETEVVVWRTEAVVWRIEAVVWETDVVVWETDAVVWRTDAVVWGADVVVWGTDAVVWRTEVVVWGGEGVITMTEEAVTGIHLSRYTIYFPSGVNEGSVPGTFL